MYPSFLVMLTTRTVQHCSQVDPVLLIWKYLYRSRSISAQNDWWYHPLFLCNYALLVALCLLV